MKDEAFDTIQTIMCMIHIVAGATKPRISKMLNDQESQKNMAA